ncbi:MAG TPA: KpsF/GutQ family sugar-phosphate isomerase [Caulobacteraceae bacterium]|nr:KpsF/GutQ family sugar-phosphate isomerase [Caulobacteraceae bacterium]
MARTLRAFQALEPVDHAASAVRTVSAELEGLKALAERLQDGLRRPFEAAVEAMANAEGRVVVTGMGKSGHVARKIAATLASTGTPAFFLHPGEASHGDLGMVARGDVVLALSWSGGNPELSDVVHHCKRFDVPLVAMTSEANSALAGAADIALILPKAAEACRSTHAPTTSTTMQLAFGDALAIALLEAHGFSAADFRDLHPGGKLAAKLVTVGDLMGRGEAVPMVPDSATLSEAIIEMTAKRYGGAAVVDGEGRLVGSFTDGDLRRALPIADLTAKVADHMNPAPVSCAPHLLATEALRLMNERERPILLMFVLEDERLVGAVGMHDFLRAGIA